MRSILKGFGAHPSVSGDQLRMQLVDQVEQAGTLWLWATDADGAITYLSDSAQNELGQQRGIIGTPLKGLMEIETEIDDERGARPLSFLLNTHARFSDLTVRVSSGGEPRWWLITGNPQLCSAGNFKGYHGSARDITDEFARRRSNYRALQFDPLTGLANRTEITKRLTSLLGTCQAAERSCALMVIDLDKFKKVNDSLGENVGDEILKQVAQRLERIVEDRGLLGRRVSDEFVIIAPDVDDRGELASLAQRITQMISQPYSVEGHRVIIGASIGIAIAPYDGIEPDELSRNADLALYAAKQDGHGLYHFYSTDLQDQAQMRRQIEEDLRDALSNGQLEMHYQPVVKAATNVVAGYEALMRWEHPVRGQISPALFIPIAEEAGLIGALGEWALRQACSDAAKWPGDLWVAVNVSVNQFDSQNLPDLVSNALANSGLSARRLELEITESVFIGDADTTDAMFARLKKLGVRLALDDFGTGYSSLGYLRKAPFDKVKIDQGFVRDSTKPDNSNSAIIAAIVTLAQALGMETTAEGVEAMDQLDLVKDRGATYIQGFLFSRAVRHDDVMAKLAENNFTYEPAGPLNTRSDRRRQYRRIGVIHEDHRYEAVLRDLSKSGARIEGLLDVPVGTELVLDLGEGQLVVCTVRRSQDATQGVEFETHLISNGADGLCTRQRVSPYRLAAAGMPLGALPAGEYPLLQNANVAGSKPRFLQVDTGSGSSRAA